MLKLKSTLTQSAFVSNLLPARLLSSVLSVIQKGEKKASLKMPLMVSPNGSL